MRKQPTNCDTEHLGKEAYCQKNGFFFEECESGMKKVSVSVHNSVTTRKVETMTDCEKTALGSAYVSVRPDSDSCICDMNENFSNLLKEKKIFLGALTASASFCRAIITTLSCSQTFSCQSGQMLYEYHLTAVPVMKNGAVMSVSVFLEPVGSRNIDSAFETLTDREKELVRLTAGGYPNKYIAYCMHIKEGTVKKSLHNCYQKLSVSSRAEIIRMFCHDEQK